MAADKENIDILRLVLTSPQGKSSYTPVPLAWTDPSLCCSENKEVKNALFNISNKYNPTVVPP